MVLWTFRKVAAEFNKPVFYADVEEVGYKRRRQGGDLARRNDLFRVNALGEIIDARGDSVLDRMLGGVERPTRRSFLSDFVRIGDQPFLRCDPKYRWFWDHRGGVAFPDGRQDRVPLRTFLAEVTPRVLEKGPLESERSLIELDDVEGGTGRIQNVQLTDEIGSNKIEFGTAQIVLSKLEPYLGKAFLNDPAQAYIGSTEWLLFDVRGSGNPRFWLALLLSATMREVFGLIQSGKRHARLSALDFGEILVPDVSIAEQDLVVSELEPFWRRLSELSAEGIRIREAVSERLAVAVSSKDRARKNSN